MNNEIIIQKKVFKGGKTSKMFVQSLEIFSDDNSLHIRLQPSFLHTNTGCTLGGWGRKKPIKRDCLFSFRER